MGHIRIGRLPKSRQWSEIVDLIGNEQAEVSDVARAVVEAARSAYESAGADPGIVESVRIMAELAVAARSKNFEDSLRNSGYRVEVETDAISFLDDVFREADRRIGRVEDRTIFTEFASVALREALTEVVSAQSGTLFTSGLDDVQAAYRAFSTQRGFAKLSRSFFSKVLSRSLRYFTDHEASNLLGSGRLANQDALHEFNRAIDGYAYEAARIVEEFGGAWYSKRSWLEDTGERAGGFTAVAMRKLSDELAQAQ